MVCIGVYAYTIQSYIITIQYLFFISKAQFLKYELSVSSAIWIYRCFNATNITTSRKDCKNKDVIFQGFFNSFIEGCGNEIKAVS